MLFRSVAVLTSSSNCGPDNAPWNVTRDGKLFVQETGAIGDAVHAILTAADPARWPLHHDPRSNWYSACEKL